MEVACLGHAKSGLDFSILATEAPLPHCLAHRDIKLNICDAFPAPAFVLIRTLVHNHLMPRSGNDPAKPFRSRLMGHAAISYLIQNELFVMTIWKLLQSKSADQAITTYRLPQRLPGRLDDDPRKYSRKP